MSDYTPLNSFTALPASAPAPELFEALLMLGKMLGLSRSVATVFALLYSAETPLTVEELVEATSLSKSAVSLALRDLMQLGAVQERTFLGERSRRYSGQPDLTQVARDVILARLRYPLSELRDKLHQSPFNHSRMEQVRNLLDAVDHTLTKIQAENQS